MISKTVRNVCETGKIHLIENYDLAQNDIHNMWECHHRLEIQDDGTELSSKELKERGLYWKRPPSELIFLMRKEHRRLHNDSILGREAKQRAIANRPISRTNWIERFKGKSKQDIAIEIEALDISYCAKSSLRNRFVINTPYTYRRTPVEKKVRKTHDWNKELEGKTHDECEEIINNTKIDDGYRSRLRKRFCPNFKRCKTGSDEWKERLKRGLELRRISHPPKTYEKKGCKFSRKYALMSKEELIAIILDDTTTPRIRFLICDKLINIDYNQVNTKNKRIEYRNKIVHN